MAQAGRRGCPYVCLEGVVRHAPIPHGASLDLCADFARSLPRKLFLRGTSEVLSFEATSEWIDTTTRYIVAIAAFFSGDPDYAERLFLSVEDRLKRRTPRFPPIREIAQRLPQRMIALYDAWLRYLVNRYILTRDRKTLADADDIARKLLERMPSNYGGLLIRSIAAFQLRRDIVEARRHLRGCRRVDDGTWRYNEAFLSAYEGNLDSALRQLLTAVKARTGDVTVPLQSEEFIHDVIVSEPDKYQLFFCSGLINEHAKHDVSGAIRDYTAFIEQARPRGEYAACVAYAQNALQRLSGMADTEAV